MDVYIDIFLYMNINDFHDAYIHHVVHIYWVQSALMQ